eukprot:1161454-Pelagomonas_calceolata.AAC.4
MEAKWRTKEAVQLLALLYSFCPSKGDTCSSTRKEHDHMGLACILPSSKGKTCNSLTKQCHRVPLKLAQGCFNHRLTFDMCSTWNSQSTHR